MPEVFETSVELGQRPIEAEQELQKRDVSANIPLEEVLSAAFRTENTVGSFLVDAGGRGEFEIAFDPFQEAEDRGIDALEWDRYTHARNRQDFDRINKKIVREEEARKTIQDSGAVGVASIFAAGVLDPINFLPIGGAIFKSAKAGKSFINGAINTAAVAAPSIAASESLLYATQETRTIEEAGVNIAAGALLGGILGGGAAKIASKLTGKSTQELGDQLITTLDDSTPKVPETIGEQYQSLLANEARSVGAAAAEAGGSNKLLSTPLSKPIEVTTAQLSPGVRLANSEIQEVRDISEQLFELTNIRQKNVEGEGTAQSVESRIKLYNYELGTTVEETRQLYHDYKKQIKNQPGKKLEYKEFLTEVSKALIRGDEHPNAFVKKAAQIHRKRIYDPILKKSKEVGLLPEDFEGPETSISFLTRMYNVRKINKQEGAFRQDVGRWLDGQLDDYISAQEKILRESNAGTKAYEDAREALDVIRTEGREAYVSESVSDMLRAIRGQDQIAGFPTPSPIARGPFKGRTVFVPDEILEEYLERDAELLARRYTRIASAEVELQRTFGTTRFEDLSQRVIDGANKRLEELQKEAREKLAKADTPEAKEKITKKLEKDLDKMRKQESQALNDLQSVWELVRGTYRASTRAPDDGVKRAAAAMRTLNYVRLMGGVVISSMADIAMPVFVHGIQRVAGDAWGSAFKQITDPAFQATMKKKLATSRRAGIGFESALNTRTMSLYEVGDPYAQGTAFERFLNNVGEGFSKYSGLNFWNDLNKDAASVVAQNRILDNVLKEGKLNKTEELYMNSLGLGPDQRRAIKDQYQKFGYEENGIKLLGDDLWEDQRAAEIFKTALVQDVDRTIVTKGVGDVPILFEGDVGKTVAQFMSFGFASNQRVLLSGLQRADANALQGVLMLVSMGMLVEAIKTWERGDDLPENPAELLAKGIDRSGIISVPMFLNDKAVKPFLEISSGDKPAFIAGPRALTAALGPSAGLVLDTLQISTGLASLVSRGEIKESDIAAGRRILPYQNLTGMRHLFDAAEAGLKEAIGE